MNGDCFAVTLIDNDENEVKHIFSKVQKKTEGKCTLSAGCVSLREYFVTDAWTLYQYAENSLDYAKAQGKNTIWFFSADDHEKILPSWS